MTSRDREQFWSEGVSTEKRRRQVGMGPKGKTILLPGVRVQRRPCRPLGSPLTKFAWVVLAGATVSKTTHKVEIACRVKLLGADADADADGYQHIVLDGLGMVNIILVDHALVCKVVQPKTRDTQRKVEKRRPGNRTERSQQRYFRGKRYGQH